MARRSCANCRALKYNRETKMGDCDLGFVIRKGEQADEKYDDFLITHISLIPPTRCPKPLTIKQYMKCHEDKKASQKPA